MPRVHSKRESTVFQGALYLTIISVGYPIALLILLAMIGVVLHVDTNSILLLYALLAAITGFALYRKLLAKVDLLKAKQLSRKGDFEKFVGLLGLLFGLGAALFSISSFYGQTVTRSGCFDPPNLNVTSPNCKTIQTVSVVQSNQWAQFATLAIESTLAFILVFCVWLAFLYETRNAEKES